MIANCADSDSASWRAVSSFAVCVARAGDAHHTNCRRSGVGARLTLGLWCRSSGHPSARHFSWDRVCRPAHLAHSSPAFHLAALKPLLIGSSLHPNSTTTA